MACDSLRHILWIAITFLFLALSIHPVAAQTTVIDKVTYVNEALYDIDTATTSPPLIVNASVSYSDAKPGYFLATGVFELDTGNLVNGLGSSTPQSCVSTPQFAGCIVALTKADGSENFQFLLSRPQSVWNLALVTAILDSMRNPISNSFSDYTFTINVYSALRLTIDAPSIVPVTVDGTTGSGGSVQLVLRAGMHGVSVPELVQVGNDTRLKFVGWSDGVDAANRTVALNWDITLRAIYVTQYDLQVASPVTVTGTGWYDSGSTVYLSTSPIAPMGGVLGVMGGEWVLQGWLEDGAKVSNSTNAAILMNSSHKVSVVWRANLNYPLLIVSTATAVPLAIFYAQRRKLSSKSRKKRRRSRIRKHNHLR